MGILHQVTPMPTTTTRARRKRFTEQDLLQMPNDGRKYELIRGRLRTVPTGARHGEIVSGIIARLHAAKTPTVALYSESVGFRMRNGNVRSPDASIMRRERLPEGVSPDAFVEGAPDLAVEVVSPSERDTELLQKVAEYFESGAREVWLLFPDRQQVYRYTAPLEMQILNADDTLTGGELLPDFQVRVGELFE
jgi:Uma2 family endonuclease